MATVEVRYVNGHLIEAAPSGWPRLRGDGVDYVDLRSDDGQAYRVQGRSCYWLYREDGLWVAGGGTVTDVEEVVAAPGGFEIRRPDYMSDLAAFQIKWGWWDS